MFVWLAANSRQQLLYSTLQLSDIEETADTSSSAIRPSTSTEPEFMQPTTSAASDDGAIRAGRVGKRARSVRFRARSRLDTNVSAGEDSQLFDKWLSSEIDKNYTKIDLIEAKKELIEILKQKNKLEIQKLQAETIVFSLEP